MDFFAYRLKRLTTFGRKFLKFVESDKAWENGTAQNNSRFAAMQIKELNRARAELVRVSELLELFEKEFEKKLEKK